MNEQQNSETRESIYLDGTDIAVRSLTLRDVTPAYCAWLNDPEINRFLESRFNEHTVEALSIYVSKQLSDPRIVFCAIDHKQDGVHIGNIKLGPIDGHHRLGDIGILLGERSYWGRGYATAAIELLCDFAFETLCLNKITAGCYSNNLGSVRAFERAGFIVEGKRARHFLCDGQYVDWILMARFNSKQTPSIV